MAPANAITCARTYDSNRQATNEKTIVMAPFFGLLVSEKPARVVHDLRKINPYQSAPSSHWKIAVTTITIMACLVRTIDIKIAEQVTACILESSTTGLRLDSRAQKPHGTGLSRAPFYGSRRNHD